MSRSDWHCRHCGRALGRRHHSGRLHPAPDVTVYVDLKGRRGPFVRLVCPSCGRHRDYENGPVVVHSNPSSIAQAVEAGS